MADLQNDFKYHILIKSCGINSFFILPSETRDDEIPWNVLKLTILERDQLALDLWTCSISPNFIKVGLTPWTIAEQFVIALQWKHISLADISFSIRIHKETFKLLIIIYYYNHIAHYFTVLSGNYLPFLFFFSDPTFLQCFCINGFTPNNFVGEY